MIVRILLLAAFLVTVPGRSAAQTHQEMVPPRDAVTQSLGFRFDARLVPHGILTPPAAELSREDVAAEVGELSVTPVKRRPWWVYPAVGAAVGGAAMTYVTVRACQGEECIAPFFPPLVGVAAGATAGLIVELFSRE